MRWSGKDRHTYYMSCHRKLICEEKKKETQKSATSMAGLGSGQFLELSGGYRGVLATLLLCESKVLLYA